MQIALAAIVLFAGAWFAVLRPKADGDTASSTPAPAQSAPKAPGQKGLENAVDKAKDAVAASNASAAAKDAAAEQASGGTSAKPAATKATGAKPAPAAAKAKAAKPARDAKPTAATDPSLALLAKLAQGKTVVIVFSQPKDPVARTARKAVRRLAAADKRVVVAYASVQKVGDYEAITAGVPILDSPTVVVVGKGHKALTVSGFTEVATLKQMVGDVRRAAASRAAKK